MRDPVDTARRALQLERERLDHLFYSGLSPAQSKYVQDEHRIAVGVCGRRAGKTKGLVRKMGRAAHACRNGLVGYITETLSWARDLVWDPSSAVGLRQMDKELGLGGEFNDSRLDLTYPNGSRVFLGGAKDIGQCEKFRGMPFRLLVLDEAGSFNPDVLRYIVKEIVPAALSDYRGTLCITGTPHATADGYFYDVATDPNRGASVHHWTVRDNPYFPRWAGHPNWEQEVDHYLEEERALYGYTEQDPAYLREYLGLWVRDETEFIYHLDQAAPYEPPPSEDVHCVMGMDLGWKDQTAFVPVGYSQFAGKVWDLDEFGASSLTFDDIKTHFARMQEKWHPERCKIDPPGEGKIIRESLAKEMWGRFGIEVTAADKSEKGAMMRLLDSDIRTGRVHLRRGTKLWHQMKTLQWDKHRAREAEGQPCDFHDAFLYAFREARHYIHLDKQKAPGVQEKLKQDFLSRERARDDPDWYG